jgi:hypothetical protein
MRLLGVARRNAVGTQEGIEVRENCDFGFSVAVNRPAEQGAADYGLNGVRKPRGGAAAKLTGAYGFIEQGTELCLELPRVREGEAMEIAIGEVHFEKREMIRESFRRLRHPRHAARHGFDRLQRGAGGGAKAAEFLVDARSALSRDGEQQAALGAESLHQRGGCEADFLRDIGESEAGGPQALDDASDAGEDVGIGFEAWARRHGGRDYKRIAVHKQDLTVNEPSFINGKSVRAKENRHARCNP